MQVRVSRTDDGYAVTIDGNTLSVSKEDIMLMSEVLRWYAHDNFGEEYKAVKKHYYLKRHAELARLHYDPSKRDRERDKAYARRYREENAEYLHSKEYKLIRAQKRQRRNDKDTDYKKHFQIYGDGTYRCSNGA